MLQHILYWKEELLKIIKGCPMKRLIKSGPKRELIITLMLFTKMFALEVQLMVGDLDLAIYPSFMEINGK